MNRLILSALAGIMLTACATNDAQQGAGASSAPMAVAETSGDPAFEIAEDEEICRRVEQTGTRFHTRVCKTRAEWAQQARAAQDATRNMQRETAIPQCALTNNC